MPHFQLDITKDGSHTLYSPTYDDTYHSRHGALQEAIHVFINNGLKQCQHISKLSILEMGFGTGLNTLLTLHHQATHQRIHYTSLERHPLPLEITQQLNYSQQIQSPYFDTIHDSPWNQDISLTSTFTLHKAQKELEIHIPQHPYHLIYYDAFGPRVQPELWTEPIFKKLYQWLRPGGIIVTYCAKGSVKRALKSVGFTVETLPGPPGKREMIRSTKPLSF